MKAGIEVGAEARPSTKRAEGGDERWAPDDKALSSGPCRPPHAAHRKGRQLHTIDGGVLTLSTRQLCIVWSHTPLADRRIDPGFLPRLWLWLREWQTERSYIGPDRTPVLSRHEAADALGVRPCVVTKGLAALQRSGLILELSESSVQLAEGFEQLHDQKLAEQAQQMHQGYMPTVGEGSRRREHFFAPRRLVRLLLRQRRSRARIGTTLAHLVRSLYQRGKGRFHLRHNCAREWVEQAFGIAQRTVSRARRWLESELGFLCSTGRGWFTLEPSWKRACGVLVARTQDPNRCTSGTPINQTLPSEGSLDQKPAAPSLPGSCSRGLGGGQTSKSSRAPDPNDIRAEDLGSVGRLMALFDAFVARGELADSLPERLAFAGSAQDCLAKGHRPGAMLRHRVQRGLLNWCTNAGESAVYTAIKRHMGLLAEPVKQVVRKPQARVEPGQISPDVGLLLARNQAPRHWSPERLAQAQLELANLQLHRQRAQRAAEQDGSRGDGLSRVGFELEGLLGSGAGG